MTQIRDEVRLILKGIKGEVESGSDIAPLP